MICCFTLYRTGPCNDYRALPFADLMPAHLNDCAAGVKVPGNQFVRFGYMDDLFDTGKIPDIRVIHIALISQDPDCGPLAPGDGSGHQTHPCNSGNHGLDLLV